MSADQYLLDVVKKYLPSGSAEADAKEVVPNIFDWAKKSGYPLLDISFSGSHAKGTATSLSSDIDIFISIDSSCQVTLQAIFDSLFRYFSAIATVRKQSVSVRLKNNNTTIDLVPARKHLGNTNDHSLYKVKQNSWTKTNVVTHINLVSGSTRKIEIRFTKIWRDLFKLEFPSILLELIVLDALHGKHQGHIADNFLTVLTFIRDKIQTIRIVDPANTNNILSDDLTASEKKKIADQAALAIQAQYWSQVVW